MVCRPLPAVGTHSEVAYGRQMTGEGPSYRERQNVRVHCKECGEEMAFGSMLGYMGTQHGQAAEERWSLAVSPLGEEPQTY